MDNRGDENFIGAVAADMRRLANEACDIRDAPMGRPAREPSAAALYAQYLNAIRPLVDEKVRILGMFFSVPSIVLGENGSVVEWVHREPVYPPTVYATLAMLDEQIKQIGIQLGVQ